MTAPFPYGADHHHCDSGDSDQQPHGQVPLEELEDLMRHRKGLVRERSNRESLRAVADELGLETRRERVGVRSGRKRHIGATGNQTLAEKQMRTVPAVEHAVRDQAVTRAERGDGHLVRGSRDGILHGQPVADPDVEARRPARLEEHRVGDDQVGIAENRRPGYAVADVPTPILELRRMHPDEAFVERSKRPVVLVCRASEGEAGPTCESGAIILMPGVRERSAMLIGFAALDFTYT